MALTQLRRAAQPVAAALATRVAAATATAPAPSALPAASAALALVPREYHVARNTNGALPVYSDWKINKTKYIVEIRNVDGNADALKAELKASLFAHDSERARRLTVDVVRGRHLRLTGLAAHYKDDVFRWLLARGF